MSEILTQVGFFWFHPEKSTHRFLRAPFTVLPRRKRWTRPCAMITGGGGAVSLTACQCANPGFQFGRVSGGFWTCFKLFCELAPARPKQPYKSGRSVRNTSADTGVHSLAAWLEKYGQPARQAEPQERTLSRAFPSQVIWPVHVSSRPESEINQSRKQSSEACSWSLSLN